MKTALIGLDYIVDIMHPDGKIARSAPMAAERQVVERFNQAAEMARRQGWLVVLVRVGFMAGYPDQPKGSPMFGRAHEIGALDLTGPGTNFHPDLDVQPHDVVITKPRVSAFYGTPLHPLLNAAQVKRVVIGGVSTSMAVQSTARDAHDRDFHVVVAQDACAAATRAEHDASLSMLSALATITDVADLDQLHQA